MAGTRAELREREKIIKEKIKQFPKAKIWKKELENVKKQLYGHK